MEDIKLNPSVEFAGKIVSLSIEGNNDNAATMNGLAIAAAAFLLDMVVDSTGNVDETNLRIYEKAFLVTVLDAIKFAQSQINSTALSAD